MSSTSQTILENAQYHKKLLEYQDELSYAPSALSQQTTYLADLQERVKHIKKNVEELAQVTKKERKEHESYRDSTGKRLAAKMTGKKQKFEARREKEEREYVEALENEMKERNNLKTIETMIAEGNREKQELSEKSLRLSQVQNEIHALYERIFGGPTQEFPRDDQLESQLESSQQAYNRIQEHMNNQSRAVQLLSQADIAMRACLNSMQEALGYSTWDTFGGGAMSDIMERSALGAAAVGASRAHMFVQQAQHTCSDVGDVGPIRVYEISMFGDVFFDNVFSDIAAHQKMEANRNELMQAHERIRRELRAATARCKRIGPDLVEASEVLSQCRRDLDRYRRETFARVSSGGREDIDEGSSPPAYQEQGAPPPSFPEASTESTGSAASPEFTQSAGPSYPPPAGPPPHLQTQYPPPVGPPPPNLLSSQSQQPPSPQGLPQHVSSNQAPAGSSSGGEGSSLHPPSEFQRNQPSSVPSHWSNKNPFASMVMGGNSSDQGSGSGSLGPQSQYPAPAGPPPGHDGSASSEVNKVNRGSESGLAHWSSKNPFAFSLMGEHAREEQRELEEPPKVPEKDK